MLAPVPASLVCPAPERGDMESSHGGRGRRAASIASAVAAPAIGYYMLASLALSAGACDHYFPPHEAEDSGPTRAPRAMPGQSLRTPASKTMPRGRAARSVPTMGMGIQRPPALPGGYVRRGSTQAGRATRFPIANARVARRGRTAASPTRPHADLGRLVRQARTSAIVPTKTSIEPARLAARARTRTVRMRRPAAHSRRAWPDSMWRSKGTRAATACARSVQRVASASRSTPRCVSLSATAGPVSTWLRPKPARAIGSAQPAWRAPTARCPTLPNVCRTLRVRSGRSPPELRRRIRSAHRL
jgi:hypothetical protein